jgi:hypothetical protein
MNDPDAPIIEKMSGPSHEQISVVAYFIWMSEGCPEGRQEANWYDAERQLAESSSNCAGADRSKETPKITEPEKEGQGIL